MAVEEDEGLADEEAAFELAEGESEGVAFTPRRRRRRKREISSSILIEGIKEGKEISKLVNKQVNKDSARENIVRTSVNLRQRPDRSQNLTNQSIRSAKRRINHCSDTN